MKPSERIQELLPLDNPDNSASIRLSQWVDAIVAYLDEQAEKGDV